LVALMRGAAVWAHEPPPMQALDFVPPVPGSYQLHAIMPAPDGEVLNTTGQARALADFTRGKITLLGLIYTRCGDPDGCPRAWSSFSEIRRALKSQPRLGERIRLVSLSFDPAHDTPAVMKGVAKVAAGRDKSIEWDFLTTAAARQLVPIIEGFGQDLRVSSEANDRAAPPIFSHTLKVFLIDRQGQVREIYSNAFLLPQMVINDIKTLALETGN
jgi:protein SCO1/2